LSVVSQFLLIAFEIFSLYLAFNILTMFCIWIWIPLCLSLMEFIELLGCVGWCWMCYCCCLLGSLFICLVTWLN
jgi:hypothetical protein